MKKLVFGKVRQSYRHTIPVPRRGQVFAGWTFLRVGYDDGVKGATQWNVRCRCGRASVVGASKILEGKSSKCRSCAMKEACRTRRTPRKNRYVLLPAPLQKKWREIHKGLRNRCENPKDKGYRHYVARGIFVDQSVRDPADFCRVIMNLKGWDDRTGKLSLDRIDNDGPYASGNLRMATRSEQNKNRWPSRGPRRISP